MYLLRKNKKVYPVYWIHNFLSDEEIEKIIDFSKKINFEKARVGNKFNKEENQSSLTSHIKEINIGNVPRLRETNIKWIFLEEETKWLYEKIIDCIHKVNQENFDLILKFLEDLQFSEYTESEKSFYAEHVDCGKISQLEHYVDVRKLSFSIQLSDESDYEGGELCIYGGKETLIAPKNKGTIIFFLSDTMHEVKPIKKGKRYSLVSWVSGPNLR